MPIHSVILSVNHVHLSSASQVAYVAGGRRAFISVIAFRDLRETRSTIAGSLCGIMTKKTTVSIFRGVYTKIRNWMRPWVTSIHFRSTQSIGINASLMVSYLVFQVNFIWLFSKRFPHKNSVCISCHATLTTFPVHHRPQGFSYLCISLTAELPTCFIPRSCDYRPYWSGQVCKCDLFSQVHSTEM
jgi:hypothetical protein